MILAGLFVTPGKQKETSPFPDGTIGKKSFEMKIRIARQPLRF